MEAPAVPLRSGAGEGEVYGRLRARRREAVAIAGEPIFRLWELYLAGCIHHFDGAKISVNQSLLARPAEGKVGLPWSRADLFRS